MATMLENHIAWMKKEVASLADRIRIIEDEEARFYSRHDGEPEVDMTQTFLAENKLKKAELENLLKQYGIG
ncbi:hypothetical protein GCM10010869_71950 [Mesorhizobium tianshanense]|uniref:Uncharacterized protein n=1 Tax=Mesorhizobium tianshanense TaxID=39844 RepID=A0A562P3X8_9HYPH|nr:hypothetical protein [Mesorhizobium tianshanense]TWI39162.1 hypothetical protein IQ26_02011 [Mesorhizobium tianshanense]GLS41598.1 hypothetical protein GCM10010869_71950 [Mesorhizobium tianshanense]